MDTSGLNKLTKISENDGLNKVLVEAAVLEHLCDTVRMYSDPARVESLCTAIRATATHERSGIIEVKCPEITGDDVKFNIVVKCTKELYKIPNRIPASGMRLMGEITGSIINFLDDWHIKNLNLSVQIAASAPFVEFHELQMPTGNPNIMFLMGDRDRVKTPASCIFIVPFYTDRSNNIVRMDKDIELNKDK